MFGFLLGRVFIGMTRRLRVQMASKEPVARGDVFHVVNFSSDP